MVRLAVAIVGSAMVLAATLQPVAAQSSSLGKPASEPLFSIDFYRTLDGMAILHDRHSAESLIWFAIGLRTTLVAANDTYVSAGAKRRVCIPSEVSPGDLLDAINDELDRNEAYWETRKEESIVPLALAVFAKNWPCK
jgi:hypothetical protein